MLHECLVPQPPIECIHTQIVQNYGSESVTLRANVVQSIIVGICQNTINSRKISHTTKQFADDKATNKNSYLWRTITSLLHLRHTTSPVILKTPAANFSCTWITTKQFPNIPQDIFATLSFSGLCCWLPFASFH